MRRRGCLRLLLLLLLITLPRSSTARHTIELEGDCPKKIAREGDKICIDNVSDCYSGVLKSFNSTEEKRIVDEHNALRNGFAVNNTLARMHRLVWDASLVSSAQGILVSCFQLNDLSYCVGPDDLLGYTYTTMDPSEDFLSWWQDPKIAARENEGEKKSQQVVNALSTRIGCARAILVVPGGEWGVVCLYKTAYFYDENQPGEACSRCRCADVRYPSLCTDAATDTKASALLLISACLAVMLV